MYVEKVVERREAALKLALEQQLTSLTRTAYEKTAVGAAAAAALQNRIATGIASAIADKVEQANNSNDKGSTSLVNSKDNKDDKAATSAGEALVVVDNVVKEKMEKGTASSSSGEAVSMGTSKTKKKVTK